MIEDVTPAEMVAAEIEGNGESIYTGSTRVITVRMPLMMAVDLQALAKKSGKTRNAMVISLLNLGLTEVRKHLSDSTLQELRELHAEALDDEIMDGIE